MVAGAVALVLGGAAWLAGRASRLPAGDPRAEGSAATEEAGGKTLPKAFLEAQLPAARGARTIRGQVVGPDGPVAGAIVTATSSAGQDVLSELPCQCGNECGRKLLECGCGEAAGQLMELVAERRGEAPPMARARTAAEGRFVLEGLEDGTYAVWADARAGVGLAQHVRAGEDGVAIDLSGGLAIRGRVTREDGTGIAGAVVTAIYARHSRFFDALAGPDGAFAIGPVPAGDYSVVASAPGLLPARGRVSEREEENLRLELDAPRALAGRVTLDGAPAAGARVLVTGQHKRVELAIGEDGAFSLQALRPGDYQLRATSGARVGRRDVTIAKGRDELGVLLDLATGIFVEGTVRDEAGAAVAGARVRVDATAPGRIWTLGSTRTGPDGRYRVGPVEPGTLAVSAERERYVARPVKEVTTFADTIVDLRLQRAATIQGVLVDPDGRPLPEIQIRAEREGMTARSRPRAGEGPRHAWATTGDDGTFTLDTLPGEYQLEPDAPAFLPSRLTVRAPAAGVRLQLERGATVQGLVTAGDGAPVEGANVWLAAPDREWESLEGKRATSDSRGRFRLAGSPAGRLEVLAMGPIRGEDATDAGAPSAFAHAKVDVPRSGTVEVALRFDGALSIGGLVVDADGAGVPGVKVAAMGMAVSPAPEADTQARLEAWSAGHAKTDGQGRFTIGGLKAGQHQVVARRPGFEQGDPVTVDAGELGARIVLTRTAMVRARVIDEQGGSLPRFLVNGAASALEGGRLELPIERSGELRLEVSAEGFAPLQRTLQVKRDVDLDLGDLTLTRGRPVTGRVIDAETGAPVPGARVALAPPGDVAPVPSGDRSQLGGPMSGPDGRFTMPGGADGARLHVEREGYLPWRGVVASTVAPVTVRLERGASLSIRVLSAAGEPLPGEPVVTFGPDGVPRFAPTGDDGRAEVTGLEGGVYLVDADPEATKEGFVIRRVVVPDRAHLDIDVRGRSEGATLQVNLSGPGVRHLALVALYPGAVSHPQRHADVVSLFGAAIRSRGEGPTRTFRLLEPGRYTALVVVRSGEAFGLMLQPVEVGSAAGQRLDLSVPESLPPIP